MATTSASSVQKSFTYEVFLSFRGVDTRKGFVDHLYHYLVNKGIVTYKDDENVEKGEKISEQLIRSIKESRFYIIVFSKTYASSSWCLEELVKIMECQKMPEHIAYPVFYDVEPTEVRNQSGAVGEAFAKHVEKESAVRWRDALKEAADLAGWELRTTAEGYEAKFMQELVKHISLQLHSINLSVDEQLVGMETRVMKVVTYLETGSDDVKMIGITGIGGGGKSTLARAVFDHMSIWFDGKSFVENVRERSIGSGLKKLQKQVLKDVLKEQNIDVSSVSDGKNMMRRRMCGRKALVVLDNVDNIVQLEALAGGHNWFKPGSTIIITTRDKQVLVAHGVKVIHDVTLLSNEEATCLFSRYAFGRETSLHGYEELSQKVIQYASGLPLTIKVLGSHLRGVSECEWVDTLERLETFPLKETLEILEISYDGLEKDHKEIFLDVACMLKGETKDEAIRILESCGFHAKMGLTVLERKSLITISDIEGLCLHDSIEEMGRNIVRRLHPHEPKRHSHLWIKEEIEDILKNDLGTEETLCIKLNYTDLYPADIIKGLRKMKKLRFLYVHSKYNERYVDEYINQYLPDSLQYLNWPCCSLGCSPVTFLPNNLVNLKMVRSNINQLWYWGDRKGLNKLRFLDLKFSMLRTFDFSLTPVLERLDVRGCKDLVQLRMLEECPKLKFLSLSGSKLTNLKLGSTPHLETLDLAGCYDFVDMSMPVRCSKLKFLNLSGSKLISFDIGLTPSIVELYLEECNDFVQLRMPVKCLELKILNLSGSKLSNLDLRLTPRLEKLDLRGCNDFVKLHMPNQCLNLKYLCLSGSKLTKLSLDSTPHLEMLDLGGCCEFVELHMSIGCPKLKVLNLSGSKLSDLNIGLIPNLVELYLEKCNHFVELHMQVECQNLKFLNLSGSKLSNLNVGLTPCLERLDLNHCYYLQEIQAPMGCLKKLVYLNLSGCSRFKSFLLNSGSRLHRVDSLAKLQLTAESLAECPLHRNNYLPKFQFECIYDEPLPLSSGNLEKLFSFGLCACTNLESFSVSICGLQRIGELTLEGNIQEMPKNMDQLRSLEELNLSMKEIKYLPDSICMLKHLKTLQLNSCLLLEQLPKDIDKLVCLEKLYLIGCDSLRDIPDNICMMKSLKYLHLPYSGLVEKLPAELGRLEFLKELNIEGTSITHLPQSILQVKGLRIVWSRGMLHDLYGFTPLEIISRYTAAYYIR